MKQRRRDPKVTAISEEEWKELRRCAAAKVSIFRECWYAHGYYYELHPIRAMKLCKGMYFWMPTNRWSIEAGCQSWKTFATMRKHYGPNWRNTKYSNFSWYRNEGFSREATRKQALAICADMNRVARRLKLKMAGTRSRSKSKARKRK